MQSASFLILAAYFAGTVPFGLLVARFAKGVDIRQLGSGNIGATNVGRVLGARWGILVLVLDAIKGGVPAYWFPLIVAGSENPQFLHLRVACGLAAIVGHMFPCWLKFRGGKGVATALGVVAVLAWWPTLLAFLVFVASFALFQIVSLSSMLASVGFLASALWELAPDPFHEETWSLACFSIAVPLLIIVRHRSNLTRLLRGQEARYRSAARDRQSPREEGGERCDPAATDQTA